MKEKIDLTRVPRHIAIIMDGNGRWAQKHQMHRYEGHREGVVSLHEVVEAADKVGVKYLTVYTFSTENWNRPQEEIDALMALMVIAIQQEIEGLMKNNVRLQVIGDMNRLPAVTKQALEDCIEQTSKNTGITMVLAISYSAHWEIVEAAKKMTEEVKEGKLEINSIDEKLFPNYLSTKNIPDPDLLIRTGGEHRISNYLLWQLAYAEFYFTDVYWPEFRGNNLYEAIIEFQKRERRFGKTGEQVKNND
jgi:undecaprenyl diphosphate synthase